MCYTQIGYSEHGILLEFVLQRQQFLTHIQIGFFFCCPWTITYGSINNRKSSSKIGNFEKFGQAYLICSFSRTSMTYTVFLW